MNTQQMDQKQDITTALETRYLLYAVSTIMDRALPDARDGLKPVHRRILYAMNQLRLYPQSNFRKCSKIVGEVMGNYHPHGDKAIYDALARFAQDFLQWLRYDFFRFWEGTYESSLSKVYGSIRKAFQGENCKKRYCQD